MEQISMLAFGRNVEIMEVINRLINSHHNWVGTTVTQDQAAESAIASTRFDIMLLCAGITNEEEEQWKAKMALMEPAVPVIRHYGGGSGLLENEILAVLGSTK